MHAVRESHPDRFRLIRRENPQCVRAIKKEPMEQGRREAGPPRVADRFCWNSYGFRILRLR
jgi:hypothetical protein